MLQLPIPKTRLSSIRQLASSYPGRLTSRNSTPFFSSELFFINTLHGSRRKQPLYCCEGVFTAPLHSNGSYTIVAHVFVAAGMCLPSHCLAKNVYSDFTIPAFERHVTILIYNIHKLLDLLNIFVHPLSLSFKRIYEMYSRMRVPVHVQCV
jgi:hypothetical protein